MTEEPEQEERPAAVQEVQPPEEEIQEPAAPAEPPSIEEEILASILSEKGDLSEEAPVLQADIFTEHPAENQGTDPDTGAGGTDAPPGGAGNRKKGIVIGVILGLVLIAAAGFLLVHSLGDGEFREAMATARECAEDGDYEDAIEAYLAALEQKPGDPEASLGLADMYLRLGRWEDARELLEGLDLREGSAEEKRWKGMKATAEMAPEIDSVETDGFPVVRLELECGGKGKVDQAQVREMDQDRQVLGLDRKNGTLTVSYRAEPTQGQTEDRDLELTLKIGEYELIFQESYRAPILEEARVQLVSTDVSGYPTVRAYFRVESASSQETIPGLTTDAFQIRERVEGGAYVSREVHSAAPLEGRYGLNIDLVADKSDSISESDMAQIQRVMTEFVGELDYAAGDRAEILAFDSIVQQMCCYTKDRSLLVNGIHNMSTDGMTALYDALYMGVGNAALQGGARCVVGFTDGIDNSSRHTSQEVVDYAVKQQVPVYIIGVSDQVEEAELQQVANGTGGKYWFIDDLYDLQEIFDEIYRHQKELYVVEYESDKEADPHDQRELEVSVSGGGYLGTVETSFQSAETIQGLKHDSRYEVVKEAVTWEEARQRCQEMGGHLATVASQKELDELTRMADAKGLRYLWLGGYTSYDSAGNVFGHWVTGEPFQFQQWSPNEPSRVDLDGEPEWYIMLWNVKSMGGWSWNDQRNDPAGAVKSMAKEMGFICEYENS